MSVKPNELIKMKREKLALTEADVARQVGLSIFEYADIEQYEDELFTVTHLGEVRKLCDLLNIKICDLFELDCSLVTRKNIKPNKLVHNKRIGLGLSKTQLADKIGFESLVIDQIESDAGFLEGWSFELIKELAIAINEPVENLIANN